MGRVLIIKNGNGDVRINDFARQSFQQGKKCYYNSVDGTSNEQALIELKKEFAGDGIVIMITYETPELKEIKDVYIGDGVNINDRNSIEYIMRVHLTQACHQRVIESIIDKIDLDIDADFGYGRYVIMNDMDSLYQELRERIIANRRNNVNVIVEREKTLEVAYELDELAQKDEQSVRIYPSDNVEYPSFSNLSIFSPFSSLAIAPYCQCTGEISDVIPKSAWCLHINASLHNSSLSSSNLKNFSSSCPDKIPICGKFIDTTP